jgi:hypothetical protein
MNINFFWSGDNFDYLNYLTIKSHINIGHNVKIHLYGRIPKSEYFKRIEGYVDIENANHIINISNFLRNGGNFRTASSLWRFLFLYKYGGWYSDCDAIALKPWPNDTEWVLCSGDKGLISTGVIKAPAREKMFIEMSKNMKTKWGNVHIFNHYYRKYKGNNDPNYETKLFYPYSWKQWDTLLKNV